MKYVKEFWVLLKMTGTDWLEDRAQRMGAALAYYSIFSLAPLLLIIIGVASHLFGEKAARDAILGQIENLAGAPASHAVGDVLRQAHQTGFGTTVAAIGLALLGFGAAGVFVELQDDLNAIWKVKPKPGLGLWDMLRSRLLSFAVVLGTGFLLIVSLVVSALLHALGEYVGRYASALPGGTWVWMVVNQVLSFAVLSLLFAMIYRLLPDAKIAWGDVWFGALVTTALFILGKYLIGLYLGQGSLTSAFGAAGSVAVLMVWVYYSAQIFLFGAEFTRAYAIRRGSHVTPTAIAEPVSAEARAKQGMTAVSDSQVDGRGNVPQPTT